MSLEVKHISYTEPDALTTHLNQSTYEAIIQAITKYVPPGSRVLDVGCGRGEILKWLSENGYTAYGCDMDDKCVAMSSSYGEVQKMAVEEMSPARFNGKFECVVMSHVLEHLESPKEVLVHLMRSSASIMVLSIPNPYYSPFVLHALLRRNVKHVNTGHLYSWDWHHFKTFIEVGCKQKILEWFYDSVALPVPSKIRNSLNEVGLLYSLENKLLKAAFPRFCRSITAVVRVEN